jgi:hypothetical protein
LRVTPAAAVVLAFERQQFQATAVYDDGTSSRVTEEASWESLDSAVATIAPGGLATAGETPGTTTISASYRGASGSATLEVRTITALTIGPAAGCLAPGDHHLYTARVRYNDGGEEDVSGRARWQSSNTAVAEIDPAGLATARRGGKTDITASYWTTSGMQELNVGNLVASPLQATLPVGDSIGYQATIVCEGRRDRRAVTASWSSSNPGVAAIDRATGWATAAAAGDTAITASFQSAVSGPAALFVCQPPDGSCSLDEECCDGGACHDGLCTCRENGEECTEDRGCCSGLCIEGHCGGSTQCRPQGQSCAADIACCSGLICVGGTCDEPQCRGEGKACLSDDQCCSGDCYYDYLETHQLLCA